MGFGWQHGRLNESGLLITRSEDLTVCLPRGWVFNPCQAC
jgi:hypothetical protein